MTRLFVTGDVHASYDNFKFEKDYFPEGLTLTKDDYVIVCGDFGYIWNYEGMSEIEQERLDNLEAKPWTTLFVDGNHECFPRLAAYDVEEWHGGKVHKIMPSIIHLMRGEIYNIANKKLFAFGGAQSIDKIYRIEGKSWWPEEEPSLEEFDNAINNLEKINFKPDIIITHDLPRRYYYNLYRSMGFDNKTQQMLDSILEFCPDYGYWYCGHHHINKQINDRFMVLYYDIVEVGGSNE